jgi:D-tyrosyl-tRNA(Tyr) deacylase
MKVVLQRVSAASVTIQNQKVANIQKGLLVFVGISEEDAQEDINFLVRKILHLRIFKDENGVMNTALIALQGEILVVSQFTLQAETKKGNRPSYTKAAKPDIAFPLYEKFIQALEKEFDKKVQTGVFGADMKVALVNDGPVTIVMDSKNKE